MNLILTTIVLGIHYRFKEFLNVSQAMIYYGEYIWLLFKGLFENAHFHVSNGRNHCNFWFKQFLKQNIR
jgi:hypothetical protein